MLVAGGGDGPGVEPARAVAELAELGLVRQLTEGGPRLLGQFVAAGVLDELCLTVSLSSRSATPSASPAGSDSPTPNASLWRPYWRRLGSFSPATVGTDIGRNLPFRLASAGHTYSRRPRADTGKDGFRSGPHRPLNDEGRLSCSQAY